MSDRRAQFRQWRHQRPFGGAVCLVISAIFLAIPALHNFKIGDIILTVSTISGVSIVWLSALMGLCAVAAMFWHHTRVVAGVSAMVLALVAFPAANFGGFVLGTLFGIIGASLVLAWRRVDDDAAEAAADTAVVTDAPTVADAAIVTDAPTVTDVPPAVDSPTVVDLPPAASVLTPTPLGGLTEALPPVPGADWTPPGRHELSPTHPAAELPVEVSAEPPTRHALAEPVDVSAAAPTSALEVPTVSSTSSLVEVASTPSIDNLPAVEIRGEPELSVPAERPSEGPAGS